MKLKKVVGVVLLSFFSSTFVVAQEINNLSFSLKELHSTSEKLKKAQDEVIKKVQSMLKSDDKKNFNKDGINEYLLLLKQDAIYQNFKFDEKNLNNLSNLKIDIAQAALLEAFNVLRMSNLKIAQEIVDTIVLKNEKYKNRVQGLIDYNQSFTKDEKNKKQALNHEELYTVLLKDFILMNVILKNTEYKNIPAADILNFLNNKFAMIKFVFMLQDSQVIEKIKGLNEKQMQNLFKAIIDWRKDVLKKATKVAQESGKQAADGETIQAINFSKFNDEQIKKLFEAVDLKQSTGWLSRWF